MDAKELAVLAVVGLLLFFVIVSPTRAADMLNTVLGALEDGATAIVTFVERLFA